MSKKAIKSMIRPNNYLGNNFKKGECCFCHNIYNNYGNNALPVKDARCCDKCNGEIVIPFRLGCFAIKKFS